MIEVLVRVGGVDHQQIPVLEEPIQVCVVHGAAVLGRDDAVLGLVQVQCQHVAGQHVLQEGHRVGALHPEPAHVAHVEEAAAVPGEQVLGDDALGVLDGHLPAAEVHHGGARLHVGVVELGPFELAHENPPVDYLCIFRALLARGYKKAHSTPRSVCASVLCLRDSRGMAPGCTFGVREDPHFPELRPGPILLPESFCVSPSALPNGSLSRADLPKPIRFFHS